MAKFNQSLDDIYGVKGRKPSLLGMPEGTTSDWVSNKRYHNYFRGYTEIRRINEKGHRVTERYYTSPWTVCDLSDRRYWLVRILFIVLALISIALYIFAMVQDIPGNRHWAIAIPGLPTVVFLILFAVRVGIFTAIPRKMTLWDYESSSNRLRRSALFAAAFELVTGLALIVFAFATGDSIPKTILCGVLDVIAAAAPFAVFLIEKRLPYKQVENDTVLPEGEAYPIR